MLTARAGRPGWRRAALIGPAVVVIGVAVFVWMRVHRVSENPAESGPRVSIERITALGTVIDAVILPDGKYVAYVVSDAGQCPLRVAVRR